MWCVVQILASESAGNQKIGEVMVSSDSQFLPSNVFTRSSDDKRIYARIELGITTPTKHCAPKVHTKNWTIQSPQRNIPPEWSLHMCGITDVLNGPWWHFSWWWGKKNYTSTKDEDSPSCPWWNWQPCLSSLRKWISLSEARKSIFNYYHQDNAQNGKLFNVIVDLTHHCANRGFVPKRGQAYYILEFTRMSYLLFESPTLNYPSRFSGPTP